LKGNRTWWLVGLAVVVLVGGLFWWLRPVEPGGADRRGAVRPSVLILAIDTLRGDFLHCAGAGWIQTPNIDALAADGVYFANCLATAPWTGPAFASIYTGLIPYHHGFFGRQFYSLAPEQLTMAEIFAAARYRTAAFVTISYLTHAYGMHQGFQTGDKFTDQGKGEEAKLVTASGRGFTSHHGTESFFLLLHYYDVHAPYTPPAPFDRMYYRGDPRAPGTPLLDFLGRRENNVLWNMPEIYIWLEGITDPAYPPAQYAAGVSYADFHVGQVIAHLKELDLYDDMLIVLVADHGEHLGEHGIWYAHTLPYQETLHVPLIVKWPGNLHAGTVVPDLVSGTDVLPTVLEIAGLPVPGNLDGRSLVGLASGKATGGASLLVAEEGESEGKYCKTLIEYPWKLLLFHVGGRFLPALYNLADDPLELRDLAETNPDIVARLESRLWEIIDRENPLTVQRSAPPVGLSEEERERLRALGYVE